VGESFDIALIFMSPSSNFKKDDHGRSLLRLVLPSDLLDTFCEFISASATAKA
jgi:hypothetical protein